MPIADAELAKPANAFLVRPADETVLAALRAWRDTPQSYEWWWLLIDHGAARFTALRFEDLRDLLASPDLGVTMQTRLADLPSRRENPDNWAQPWPGVYTPEVVQQDALSTAQALQRMRDAPGRILIVADGARLAGILTDTQRTFAFADRPLLDLLEDYEQPRHTPPAGESAAGTLDAAAPPPPETE